MPNRPQAVFSVTIRHSSRRAVCSEVCGSKSMPNRASGTIGCNAKVSSRVAMATSAGTRGLAGKTFSRVAAAVAEANSKKDPKKTCHERNNGKNEIA